MEGLADVVALNDLRRHGRFNTKRLHRFVRSKPVRGKLRIRNGHMLHCIGRNNLGVPLDERSVGSPEHELADGIGEGCTGNTMTLVHGLLGRFIICREQHVERCAVLDLSVESTRATERENELVTRGLFVERRKILHRSGEVCCDCNMHFFCTHGSASCGNRNDGFLHRKHFVLSLLNNSCGLWRPEQIL